MRQEWFETWFDTSYYHLLYRNRDELEARQLIDALLQFTGILPGARFLDVACGKGRHAIYLHSLGYQVAGIDLSENAIRSASEYCRNRVSFSVKDIRQAFDLGSFDVALNLFTSFGYFDKTDENISVVRNIHDSLEPGGLFIIDYLNTSYVKFHLVERESAEIDGIVFNIHRTYDHDFIVKNITVIDHQEVLHFMERVREFSRDDLYEIIKAAGLIPLHCFGDYKLSPYASNLPRVIIIAQKPK